MKRVIFAIMVLLLAAAVVQGGNIKHLGGTVGTPARDSVDSLSIKAKGISSTDLLDTLRVQGVASSGAGGITLKDGINYMTIDGGFIKTFGRFRIVSSANYYLYFALDGFAFTTFGMIGSGRDLLVGSPAADSLNLIVRAQNEVIFATNGGNEAGRFTDEYTLRLKMHSAFPDTTGYLGGEMWLGATGDSIYIYKSDHTMVYK